MFCESCNLPRLWYLLRSVFGPLFTCLPLIWFWRRWTGRCGSLRIWFIADDMMRVLKELLSFKVDMTWVRLIDSSNVRLLIFGALLSAWRIPYKSPSEYVIFASEIRPTSIKFCWATLSWSIWYRSSLRRGANGLIFRQKYQKLRINFSPTQCKIQTKNVKCNKRRKLGIIFNFWKSSLERCFRYIGKMMLCI